MVVWLKPCKSRSSPGALPEGPAAQAAGPFLCARFPAPAARRVTPVRQWRYAPAEGPASSGSPHAALRMPPHACTGVPCSSTADSRPHVRAPADSPPREPPAPSSTLGPSSQTGSRSRVCAESPCDAGGARAARRPGLNRGLGGGEPPVPDPACTDPCAAVPLRATQECPRWRRTPAEQWVSSPAPATLDRPRSQCT